MTATTQTEALNAARANYYRFLRRFYFQEVDTPLWAQLRQMNIPADCPQPRMAEGYEMLRDFLARHDADILDELAADCQEVVHLVERDNSDVIYIYKAEPARPLVRMAS